MSSSLRILITTDSFPPLCGGSGWSTWELARGLTARGHDVAVVKVDAMSRVTGVFDGRFEGVRVTNFARDVMNVPVVRNIVKNEALWGSLSSYLTDRIKKDDVDIVHAQHVMTTVASIRAGAATSTPVVATVRDYWPVCYWSDLIYDPAGRELCPACTVGNMRRCVRPRSRGIPLAGWSVIPYMRANLRRKRQTLAKADAVIAVSHAIGADLRQRAPELASTPLYTIPNPVDMTRLDAVREQAPRPLEGPYVLYAGKLAVNKGVQFLIQAMQDSGVRWPLVVAGDGPLRGSLAAEGTARGLDVRELGWISREDTWAWMRHATMLAFPSYGPESLSRVLIEASALGVPIAAMDTGGTRDIVKPGETGLLSLSPEGFGHDLARLAGDERLRAALGVAARADARARFSTDSVVGRIEQVYRSLLLPEAA
jgi:glycosyltransferase involved in cell wall biosynthesis